MTNQQNIWSLNPLRSHSELYCDQAELEGNTVRNPSWETYPKNVEQQNFLTQDKSQLESK